MAVTNFIDRIRIGDSTDEIAIGSSAYGECDTAAGTKAKTVNIPGFVLNKGTTIYVKFINRNSASNPTLNVSNTGAIAIMQYGGTAAGTTDSTTGWYAGAVVPLTYDGTNWVKTQGYNSNTNTVLRTYTGNANYEYPLLAQSSTANATTAWTEYTTSYKDYYGIIPNSSATRATINTSTGHITVPGGITADITGSATSVPLSGVTGATNLAAIEALTGSGFLKRASNNTWSFGSAVTGITLTSGAGITVSNSGTEITSTGTRTISITGVDTTDGEEDIFLSKKGTWVSISTASYNTPGLVKPYFSISGNATISETSAASRSGNVTLEDRSTELERYYAVEVDSNGILFVNVPWTNINDDYQGNLVFDGTYNATTNKVATQSTVTDAIETLDVTNISGFGTTKTLKTLTQTDGKISATFQSIAFPVTSVAGLDGAITSNDLISALGLSYAMHYRGTIATDPTITTPAGTYAAGDILVHTTTSKEYVYDGTEWRELGDESSYKVKQTAVADPTALDEIATEFISNISQNANGDITVTKKTIGNSPTATAWASAQTVYVDLTSSGTDSTLTGGSATAQVLKVDGILPIGNGGTGTSSFTDGQVVYPATANNVQTLTGNSNFIYNSTNDILTLGKLVFTGTTNTNDSSIVNSTGIVTIKSKSTMYLTTSGSGSIIFTTKGTARGRFNTSGHFIPEATNTYTLGLAAGGTESNAKRWKALFLGTQDSYGDENTPIYWTDNGVPAPATVIQKATFSLTSANSGSHSVTTNTTANSHIVEIVVDTGIQYLLSTITCTPGNNTITVSATVDGTVSGYILYIK